MFKLALLNIIRNLPRFIITLLVIGIAFSLIFIVEGFSNGISKQATIYFEKSEADLAVVQKGAESVLRSRSILSERLEERLRKIEGVTRVSGIITEGVTYSKDSNKTPVSLMGVDPGSDLGQPWKIGEGSKLQNDRQVVLDLSLARRYGIKVGDEAKILGKNFEVVGLSRETSSFMSPYVFITKKSAGEIFLRNKTVSFFLVKLESRNQLNRVKQAIEREVGGVEVRSIEKISQSEEKLMRKNMGGPVNAILYISYIIGALVIGLTLYTAVVEKITEYGVIKAIGAKLTQLLVFVLQQSVISTFFGFSTGIIFYALISSLIEYQFPQFLILINFEVILKTFVIGIMMAVGAVLFPVTRVSRLEPAIVFRR